MGRADHPAQRQAETQVRQNPNEVRDWLLSQREALHDGDWVGEDKVTVTDFLDLYLKDVAAHTLRPKTLEAYEYLIRLHIKPELGSTRLSALRPDQLQRLYSEKLNSGLSHRTVQFIRFHDFSRHTHATPLLAAGVHPKVVQERLGHSQISLTLDTYSHVIPSLQEEAAEKLNKLMDL